MDISLKSGIHLFPLLRRFNPAEPVVEKYAIH